MKIYSTITGHWDGTRYTIDNEESVWYTGKVELLCGASAAQNAAQQQQAAFATQAMQQATAIFGASSTVFQDLVSTFAPTIEAGPSQQGFSAAEQSALNSAAITNSGNAYRNAQQSVNEGIAAQNGGNVGDVTTGSTVGADLGLAESAAANTSGQLNQIQQANYATGRQNYQEAVQGLAGAPNVFNSATGATNATTQAGEASSNTANQIASQNNSWVQAVTGALGGVAGGLVTGGMSNLGNGLSFFGGTNSSGSSTGSAALEGEGELA